MPGYPKPRPEIQQRQAAAPVPPAAPPVAPARMRLGWSRGIIDQARRTGAPMPVPNVRSTAALRARAGESYRPAVRPELVVLAPVVKPAAAPASPVTRVWEPEPEPMPEPPSFLSAAWGAVLDGATAILRLLPRGPRIAD